jgi:hypothetical protein
MHISFHLNLIIRDEELRPKQAGVTKEMLLWIGITRDQLAFSPSQIAHSAASLDGVDSTPSEVAVVHGDVKVRGSAHFGFVQSAEQSIEFLVERDQQQTGLADLRRICFPIPEP